MHNHNHGHNHTSTYFYKYKFVSPDPLFARVREEMKSYFDAGVVDDLMFPIWTDKCLRKLGKSSYKIENSLLFIDGFEAKLPPDFLSVREAWLTTNTFSPIFRKPGAFYQQITTQLDKPFDACNPLVNCDPCNPDILVVTTKTTTDVTQPIRLRHLLKPGNISVRDHCDLGCLNFTSSADDTFDIRDNKMVVNFQHGDIFLIYYSEQMDESGYQLIPENYRIQEFIEAFIKQKLFETLFNQVADESFQQLERKYTMYKQLSDEAYILADIEIKKKTVYERAYAIRRDEHRNDKYKLNYRRGRGWGRGTYPSSSWGT